MESFHIGASQKIMELKNMQIDSSSKSKEKKIAEPVSDKKAAKKDKFVKV